MTRGEQIMAGALALAFPAEVATAQRITDATTVLDAAVPQITTVEQLDWYGDGTRLLDKDARLFLTLGSPYLDEPVLGLFLIPDALERFGPLTVVWQPTQPEVDR